jgi:hypothetical protein
MLRIHFNLQFIFLFVFALFSMKNYKSVDRNSRQALPCRIHPLRAGRGRPARKKYAPTGRAGE